MQLIPDWRNAWRFWSMQLGALGSSLIAVLVMVPDVAISAWLTFPDDLKSIMPPQYMPMFGVVLYVMGMVARVIRQKKLHV